MDRRQDSVRVDPHGDFGCELGREQALEGSVRHGVDVGEDAIPLGEGHSRRFERGVHPGSVVNAVAIEPLDRPAARSDRARSR